MASRPQDDEGRLEAARQAALAAGEAFARWWKELGTPGREGVSLDLLLRESLSRMREVLGADAVSLLLSDVEEHELVARAALGLSEETTFDLRIPLGAGMAGQVMATRRPLVVGDLGSIDLVSPTLKQSGMRSVEAVPILSGGRLVGVLHAASRETHKFPPQDVMLLEVMASALSAPIERVHLFEQERAARRSAESAAAWLTRLQTVTAALAVARTIEQASSELWVSLCADPETPVDWIGLWLSDGAILRPVRSPDVPGSSALGAISEASDLPPATAFRERRPVFVHEGVPELERRWLPSSLAGDTRRFAFLPVLLGGEALGILVISDGAAGDFSAPERGFLSAVSAQTAQAVDRARLLAYQSQLADMSFFFAKAARVTAEASDLEEALHRLANLALEVAGDICLIDLLEDNGRIRRMVARHRDPNLQHLVSRLRTEYTPDPDGEHPSAVVIRSGKTMWGAELSDEFLRATSHDETHFHLTKSLGFRSYVAVPLVCEGETLGSMTLVSSSRSFSRDDATFAERLSEQVAAVIENAKMLDVTLRTSRNLQARLLPQALPEVPGWQVHTVYVPSTRGMEIGGDFYDLVVVGDDEVWFTIGDVAGHDIGAAAMMGQLRSAARALVGHAATPEALVSTLQGSWDVFGFERIATAIFGKLDPRTARMAMASAGHYPPLVVGESARFLEVHPGPPLGAGKFEAPLWEGTLSRDETLLLYTDGAIDERTSGSDASMRHLADSAIRGPLDPRALCDRILGNLEVDGLDDIALMALRADPAGALASGLAGGDPGYHIGGTTIDQHSVVGSVRRIDAR